MGTEDLRVLEEAAFYALSRERRDSGEIPVKETFFHLPSGGMAVGRTIYLGTDSLGRDGNYLTHHFVFSREALSQANPFAILAAAPFAGPDEDLTPRELPPLKIDLDSEQAGSDIFIGLDFDLLAALTTAVLDANGQMVLLVGNESVARGLLRAASASLATEERRQMTFSTHFYESHHLSRCLRLPLLDYSRKFRLRGRITGRSLLMKKQLIQSAQAAPTPAYLEETLRKSEWEKVTAFNHTLDTLREKECAMVSGSLFESAKACAALWERAGTRVAPSLIGDATRGEEIH